jgi:hypothetical protein
MVQFQWSLGHGDQKHTIQEDRDTSFHDLLSKIKESSGLPDELNLEYKSIPGIDLDDLNSNTKISETRLGYIGADGGLIIVGVLNQVGGKNIKFLAVKRRHRVTRKKKKTKRRRKSKKSRKFKINKRTRRQRR